MIKRIFIVINFIIILYLIIQPAKKAPQVNLPKVTIAETNIIPDIKFPDLAIRVNSKNKAVQSFSCNKVNIRIWEAGKSLKVSGSIYYEKPKKFRMTVKTILGKELDLGSNNEIFWYWSKRDENPGLYWAKYEDFNKSRLKTPFNPIFLRSSLGLEEISDKNVKISYTTGKTIFSYADKNSMGEDIVYSIVVNDNEENITGYTVTNKNGKLVAACKIVKYEKGYPVELIYNWHEENCNMHMTLNNSEINSSIKSDMWQIPNKQPKINMAED